MVHHHGIFLLGVEVLRLHHPADEPYALGGGEGEYFLLAHVVGSILASQLLVVNKRGERLALRVAKGDLRRGIDIAPETNEILEIF